MAYNFKLLWKWGLLLLTGYLIIAFLYSNKTPEVQQKQISKDIRAQISRDVREQLSAHIREKLLEKIGEQRSEDISVPLHSISEILAPPSPRDEPYRLKNKRRKWFSQHGQDEFIVKILRSKTNGFFVEAGALDGEQFSNTLHLERNLGWTGLLIEPNPSSYNDILAKKRKAYSINACLSPNSSSAVMPIMNIESANVARIADGTAKQKKKAYVPCYPFFDILTAVGNPLVDFFSLDIEGFEMEVLKRIPWDKVKIRLITIEIKHIPEGKAALKSYMEEQGFKFYKKFKLDYMFYNPELAVDMDLSYINTQDL